MLTVCRQLLTLDRFFPLHARVSLRPAWSDKEPKTPQDCPKAVIAGAAQSNKIAAVPPVPTTALWPHGGTKSRGVYGEVEPTPGASCMSAKERFDRATIPKFS